MCAGVSCAAPRPPPRRARTAPRRRARRRTGGHGAEVPVTTARRVGRLGAARRATDAPRRRAPQGTPAGPGPGHAPVHGARLHRRGHHRRRPRTAAPSSACAIDWGEDARARPRAPRRSWTPLWADDPERDDLAQPEAVTVTGRARGRSAPSGAGGRAACCTTSLSRRQQHLLGFPGSSAPYWEFRRHAPVGGRGGPEPGAGDLPAPGGRHGVGPLRLAPQRQLAPDGGPPGRRPRWTAPGATACRARTSRARWASGPTSRGRRSAGPATDTATRPWRPCSPGPDRDPGAPSRRRAKRPGE